MTKNPKLPTALVTGGAGFIGAHVCRALLQQGRTHVVVLDDLSGGFAENVPAGAEFVQGSVADHALMEQLFARYRFRYVYHLAAYAAEGLSHFIRRFNYSNNVVASANVVNECIKHQVECLVFTSSIAVYGSTPPPMREDQVPHPEDPYGIAKYAVEMDLAVARQMFGLDYVIFRPHNVYGEYQNLGDPYRNVVGIFMNLIMQNKPMTIFGDGTQQRAFSYVGDIAPRIADGPWVAGARNHVFNLGADTPYTVNELAGHVASAMGSPEHPVMHLPARNEVTVAFSSHDKAQRIFGMGQQTGLEQGLARMAAWAKKVGIQSSRPFEGVEVSRNMPPSWERLLSRHAGQTS